MLVAMSFSMIRLGAVCGYVLFKARDLNQCFLDDSFLARFLFLLRVCSSAHLGCIEVQASSSACSRIAAFMSNSWGSSREASQSDADCARDSDRRKWESFAAPTQDYDNRDRLEQWAIDQTCDERSILVFLSMEPHEREQVRDLGSLNLKHIKNPSALLMARIREVAPRFIPYDAKAKCEYDTLVQTHRNRKDTRTHRILIRP